MKKKSGLVFTLMAIGGTILTVVTVIKKAPEAVEKKAEALKKKREETGNPEAELTFMESAQAQAGCYGPAFASAVMTIGSIIGSQVIPQKELNDIYRLHDAYKTIVRQTSGEKSEKLIGEMAEIQAEQKNSQGTDAENKQTYVLKWDEADNKIGFIFESTELDVLKAEYAVNQFMAATGVITFNEALNLFKLKEIENGDNFGWDSDAQGINWIEFEHEKGMLEDKDVIFIYISDEPEVFGE